MIGRHAVAFAIILPSLHFGFSLFLAGVEGVVRCVVAAERGQPVAGEDGGIAVLLMVLFAWLRSFLIAAAAQLYRCASYISAQWQPANAQSLAVSLHGPIAAPAT